MVDPRLNSLLVKYNAKLGAGERPTVLTDGIKNHKQGILLSMVAKIEEIRGELVNPFADQFPMLAGIHPERGRTVFRTHRRLAV